MATLHHPLRHSISDQLQLANEKAWMTLASLAETMVDHTKAVNYYKAALKHNPNSIPALMRIAILHRDQDRLDRAVKYFKRVLQLQENNGEAWSLIGHCYLVMEALQDAYYAYQQALLFLPNPKDPKLWYGIGILYDRYGSLEHAEEAFSAVIKMDTAFDKTNEIYFRLGIIYKQQQKYDLSLQCFRHILPHPPKPLMQVDIWYQMGHVYEQQKEVERAKEAYERVLKEKPDDSKVLQQYGWLFMQSPGNPSSYQTAVDHLTRSLKADSNDAQSWYLLGRCYIGLDNFNKAYEAYQQAVYRDAKNPAFWCSIGVLYYQIHQYQDALDAYNRAIRLSPYMSEVWFSLGVLYEASNNQINDAIDAYSRAIQMDPTHTLARRRIEYLKDCTDGRIKNDEPPPPPQDVTYPYQYQNSSSRGSSSSSSSSPPPPPPPTNQQQHPVLKQNNHLRHISSSTSSSSICIPSPSSPHPSTSAAITPVAPNSNIVTGTAKRPGQNFLGDIVIDNKRQKQTSLDSIHLVPSTSLGPSAATPPVSSV